MFTAAAFPIRKSTADRPARLVCGLLFAWLMILGGWPAGNPLFAQDFRVTTKLFHRESEQGPSQLLTRSLTLFRAGKAYDYVEEVGEVVIHEPTQSQFVILSLNGNKMATRIRYEELLQAEKVARHETIKYLEELRTSPQTSNRNAIQALTFQLDPQFHELFDASTGRLRLKSDFLSYEAETQSMNAPGIVQQYLEWADWTARLNSVLHPQAAVTPQARLRLNEALRAEKRIPTQVDLTISIDGETRLRAEHRFQAELLSFDRADIADYEKIRNDKSLRWVDLREYQRMLVAGRLR